MQLVDAGEGIAYGLQLIGYMAALAIVGGGAAVGTAGMLDAGNNLFAILFALAGIIVVLAGLLGITYKVIADGVQRGMLEAMGKR